jgi:hypothetical protein
MDESGLGQELSDLTYLLQSFDTPRGPVIDVLMRSDDEHKTGTSLITHDVDRAVDTAPWQ